MHMIKYVISLHLDPFGKNDRPMTNVVLKQLSFAQPKKHHSPPEPMLSPPAASTSCNATSPCMPGSWMQLVHAGCVTTCSNKYKPPHARTHTR